MYPTLQILVFLKYYYKHFEVNNKAEFFVNIDESFFIFANFNLILNKLKFYQKK